MSLQDKRTKFIINPGFQWRFIIYMTGIALIILAISYFSNQFFFSEFEKLADQMHFPSEHPYREFLSIQKAKLHSVFATAAIITIFFMIVASAYYSHKIAGPIYRIIKSLNEISSTRNQKEIVIREDDFFQELPDAINKAFNLKK